MTPRLDSADAPADSLAGKPGAAWSVHAPARAAAPRALLLVVDDQPANIQILYELFKDEHEVCMATNGNDALLFCQTRKPDLILLDVMMPELGGIETCERLKADPLTREIPVIFVTGQNHPEDEARGLQAGGADFITKPFHANVVAARVQTHLTLKHQTDLLRAREAELRQRHAELEAINDSSPLGLFHADANGAYTYVNRTFETIAGLSSGRALGIGWRLGIHAEDVEQVSAAWFYATARKLHYTNLYRYRRAGGKFVFARVQASPVLLDGVVTGFVGTIEDVTAQRAVNEALQDSERRLRMITDNLPVLVTYIDSEHRFRFANETMQRWTGHAPHDVEGRLFAEVMGGAVYEKRRGHIERALAGERIDFEMKADAFEQVRYLQSTYIPDIGPDGAVHGIYTVSNDITVLKHTEMELRQLSRFDSLTGLPNRSYLYEILDAALERGKRSGTPLAVLFLDIDHFKSINDTYGHAGGDLVLQEFARRLSHAVRKTDTVARLAGDEFVILLEGAKTRLEVEAVALKILHAIEQPWLLQGAQLTITTSIGIAFDHKCLGSGDSLIAQADEALYEAKAAGRNAFRLQECVPPVAE